MNDDTTREGGQSPARYSRTRVEQDFLEAFESFGSRAFFDYLERYLRSDGVMVCNCPPQLLQIGGTHRGYDDVVTALRSFFIEFRVLATSVDDIVIDGAHVVINYHMQLSHVGTGRTGRVSGINHYVLDADRKISNAAFSSITPPSLSLATCSTRSPISPGGWLTSGNGATTTTSHRRFAGLTDS